MGRPAAGPSLARLRDADRDAIGRGRNIRLSELVAADVVLSNDSNPSAGPVYLFTRLNDLKPAFGEKEFFFEAELREMQSR